MKKVLAFLFWAGVGFVFLTPMELGDIWWHLATGRWIVEQGALPANDPFALDFELYSGPFILKEFWLCQILLFAVYSAGGFIALIGLKSLLFTSSVFTVGRTLGVYGIRPPLSYLFLLPLIVLATGYDELRPQSFSFVFFSIALYLLERERADGPYRGVYLLPPLMLLWSNIHGGIVMGLGVAAVYAFFAAWRRQWRLPAVFAAAVFASALNPNGLHAFAVAAQMFRRSATGMSTIHEHLPLWKFVGLTGETYLYIVTVAIIAMGVLSFLFAFLKGRRPEPSGIVLFTGLAYAAMTSFKAGLFFAILAVVVAGRNLSIADSSERKIHKVFLNFILAGAFIGLLVAVILPRTIIMRQVVDQGLIPVKVAGFIKSASLPGNLYHPYEWGGYLIWELYPEYKVFIDGRMIPGKDAMIKEWSAVLEARPGWGEVLSRRGVNTAAYWPLIPYEGRVPPIIFALLKDGGWSPVYWDLQGIVFVRAGLANKPISKDAVWELLTSLISARIISDPMKAVNHTALGEIYMERGLKVDAEREFRSALAIDPHEKRAAYLLRGLR